MVYEGKVSGTEKGKLGWFREEKYGSRWQQCMPHINPPSLALVSSVLTINIYQIHSQPGSKETYRWQVKSFLLTFHQPSYCPPPACSRSGRRAVIRQMIFQDVNLAASDQCSSIQLILLKKMKDMCCTKKKNFLSMLQF